MLLLVFVDREESELIRKKADFLFSTRNSDFVLSIAHASFFFFSLSIRTPLRLRFFPLFNTND